MEAFGIYIKKIGSVNIKSMENLTKKDRKIIEKTFDSIIYLGECRCGGPLVASTQAPKSERFVVSCTDCGSVSDIRFPKPGDIYNVANEDESPLQLLCRIYKSKQYEITEKDISETPVSESVNKRHGSL